MNAQDQNERGTRATLAEWASLHTHLLWIYDGPFEPHGQGEVTAHDLTAWLLRRGSVKVTSDGQSWTAHEDEWFFPPPGRRRQEFSANARIVSVRFRAKWPTGEDFYRAGLGLAVPSKQHPELLRAALPLVRLVSANLPKATVDLMQAPADVGLHARLQMLYARWFAAIIGVFAHHGVEPTRMGRIDSRLLQAVARLDKQPLSAPLSEAELAAMAKISVSQLNRLFRRQFGVSSKGYFERRRYHYALSALENSPATIKEITFSLGFSSLQHFSAWFRKRHGVSPRHFRGALPAGMRKRYNFPPGADNRPKLREAQGKGYLAANEAQNDEFFPVQ